MKTGKILMLLLQAYISETKFMGIKEAWKGVSCCELLVYDDFVGYKRRMEKRIASA